MRLLLFLLIQFVLYVNGMVGENVRPARSGEFPFVVAIMLINNTNLESESDYICTGVMISTTNVLSIAHNIETHNMNRFEILYSSRDLRNRQRAPIRWLMTYEQWARHRNVTFKHEIDLSILKLFNAIQVTPVVLSPVPKKDLYGLNVVTAGWGNNMENETPRMMETVRLRILKKSKCKERILSITNRSSTSVHRRMICTAAVPLAFLRQGDSGGPLLYHNELVAINKGSCPVGNEDLNPRKVNIHVGIDDHRNFIVDVINHFN